MLEEKLTDLRSQMEGATGGLLHGLAAQVAQVQRELANKRAGLCRVIVVHFKSLLPVTPAVQAHLTTQFNAMRDLYAEGGIIVKLGTTEDLSGDAALQPLANLSVGQCLGGRPTADQNALFANRNSTGRNDLVVYLVSTIISVSATGAPGNVVGCATHPDRQPGAAVVMTAADWVVAHEVGHVLGLKHVDASVAANSDFLMWPNAGWTNVPPNLGLDEYRTMKTSSLASPF